MGASSAQRDRFIDSCPTGRLLASLHSLAANLLLERLPPFGALWPGFGSDRPVRIAGGHRGDRHGVRRGVRAPCPGPRRRQGSGLAALRPLPPSAAQAWGVAFHPFPSMAISKAPCCEIRALDLHTSTRMASRPMAMSATPCPSVVAASRSKRSVSCRWPVPIRSPASCRAAPAPRCRSSEAKASGRQSGLAGRRLSAGPGSALLVEHIEEGVATR